MAELKTVGVRQRYNETRDKQYDYKFPIVTLAEFLDIAKSAGRKVGVYPELKNPHLVNRLDIWEGTNTRFETWLFSAIVRGNIQKSCPT